MHPEELFHARLAAHERRNPQHPAIGDIAGRWLSYRSLIGQAGYVQAVLHAAGILADDRVAVILPDGPDCAAVMTGVSATAIHAPLQASAPDAELRALLEGLKPRAIVSDARHRALAADMGVEHLPFESARDAGPGSFTIAGRERRPHPLTCPCDPGQIAWMLHTSGTTGRSRRVPISHGMLAHAASRFESAYGLGPWCRR